MNKEIGDTEKENMVRCLCDYCNEFYYETYRHKSDYDDDNQFCSSRCEFLYEKKF